MEYKTPIEVWSESYANYDNIRVFGCPAYYHVRDEKMDLRAQNTIFLGSYEWVKDNKLGCHQGKKMVINRDVTLDEVSMLKTSSLAKVGSPDLVVKENNVSKEVVQTEVTTQVSPQVTNLVEEPSEDQESPGEGSDIPVAESGKQRQVPSLASGRKPRARRSPFRCGYKEMLVYTVVGLGDESFLYWKVMYYSENAE